MHLEKMKINEQKLTRVSAQLPQHAIRASGWIKTIVVSQISLWLNKVKNNLIKKKKNVWERFPNNF